MAFRFTFNRHDNGLYAKRYNFGQIGCLFRRPDPGKFIHRSRFNCGFKQNGVALPSLSAIFAL